MDGNGRWAQKRGYNRLRGHREGAKRVDEIVTTCVDAGVRYLTLYTFSTENWSRPSYEVNMLMRLLVSQLALMDKKLRRNQVKFTTSGSFERLPGYVQRSLKRVMKLTRSYEAKMTLDLAISYGGRQEIIDAVNRVNTEKQKTNDTLPITEADLRMALYQPDHPDPDLMIRTGGEKRISNFLLWEMAYSELYFTECLWPDFKQAELELALEDFALRQRRFGKTQEQVAPIKDQPTTPVGVSAP